MTPEEREEIATAKLADALSDDETHLLYNALAYWTSDDNAAPHDAIEKMRARLLRCINRCINGTDCWLAPGWTVHPS